MAISQDFAERRAIIPEPGVMHAGGHYDESQLPQSEATSSFTLFHFMLRIRDPKASLHFYVDLMGLRTVWTMNTGPFTIYYLGYPKTDEDRNDLKGWAERTKQIQNITHTPGLLELKHIHGSEKDPSEGGYTISNGNIAPNLGFGHLGFSVPDVRSTVESLRSEGVNVVKELENTGPSAVPLTEWERERGVGKDDMIDSYQRVLTHVAVVADPVSGKA
jgi:lactoylglutathione lyase